MRGGIIREHEPYDETDLKHEFGRDWILVLTGTEYSAAPAADPEATPVRAGSPLELARKLRAEARP